MQIYTTSKPGKKEGRKKKRKGGREEGRKDGWMEEGFYRKENNGMKGIEREKNIKKRA